MGRLRTPRALLVLSGVMVLVAVGPAAAGHSPSPQACELYPETDFAPAITGTLPHHLFANAEDLAEFVMPYALMADDVRFASGDRLAPFGFYRGPDSNELFLQRGQGERLRAAVNGMYAATFIHCRQSAIVIVYRSLTPRDPRDWIASIARQLGAASPLALAFFDAVRELYPDHWIMVAGHSAGGGLASYVGAVKDVPSIAFAPIRTDAAFLNSGDNQLIVTINGDVFADPLAATPTGPLRLVQRLLDDPRSIQGTLLRIEPIGVYPRLNRLHWISAIVEELRHIAGEGPP